MSTKVRAISETRWFHHSQTQSNQLSHPRRTHKVSWVGQLHPEIESYTKVYAEYGLLTPKTIMAHCIYLSKEELDLLKSSGASISHCASSNFNLSSGVLNVRKVVANGNKIGLGTDVSGGHAASMLDCIRQTILASKVTYLAHAAASQKQSTGAVEKGEGASTSQQAQRLSGERLPTYTAGTFPECSPAEAPEPLSYKEAFYLATAGGAESIGLGHVTGNFLPGKEFDALLIETKAPGSPFDVFDDDTVEDMFQKFIYLGDDRNISRVYVQGKKVLPNI